MYKKRLRNRSFKTTGPLQKMIDSAVEERMSALKKEDEPVWGEFAEVAREKLEDGRTQITERRTGKVPGGDDYDGSGGYAPDDEWQAFLDSPKGKEYLERTSPKQVEEERVRFLENIQPVETKSVDKIEPVERQEQEKPSYLQTNVGQQSIMELFNVNPEQGGSLTNNAKNFYDTAFSVDNPALEVLKDDKWMRKARKEYNKQNYSQKKRASMPFERWAMQTYKPKGQDGTLIDQAKQWEGDNATDTDNSQFQLPDETDAMNRSIAGPSDSASARAQSSNPFDRYREEQKRQAGEKEQPATNMKRPVTKMLQGRTMSFRKNKF